MPIMKHLGSLSIIIIEERKQIFATFQMSILSLQMILQNNDKNGRYRFRNNQGGAGFIQPHNDFLKVH
jgi:hypothetical protein